MPTSKPIYQSLTLFNSSTGKYASLYFRTRKKDNNDVVQEWYWLETTATGGLQADRRGNALNDYFDDYETAVANPPSGFGTITDNFQNEKMISYYKEHPFDDGDTIASPSVQRTLQEYSTAYAKGARNFLVKIEWGALFPSYSSQTTNSSTSYAKYKILTDAIIALGSDTKISLRICTDLDDGILQTTGTDFYSFTTDQAQDELGYPFRVAYGSGHVSLAYTTGVTKAIDCVSKVVTYFNTLYPGRIYWVAVGMTAQNEAGYNFENQRYFPTQGQGLVSNSAGGTTVTGTGTNFQFIFAPGDPIVIGGQEVSIVSVSSDTLLTVTPAITNAHTNTTFIYKPLQPLRTSLADYTTHAEAGFKVAMQTKYGTIGALNSAWGENNSDWSSIYQPKTGTTNGIDKTIDDYCRLFTNNKGKDFWEYHKNLVKGYLEDCRQAVTTVNSNIKFCLEWGDVHGVLAPLRMALLVKEMPDYSDMMKAQMGSLTINPDLSLSLDVIRSNYSKKIGTELNIHDAKAIYGATNPSQVEDYLKQIGYAAIDNGALDIVIIADSKNNAEFVAMMNVLEGCKAYQSSHGRISTPSVNVNISIGQQLENSSQLINSWKSNGGSAGTRINMNQSEDFEFEESSGCAYPLSLYTLHKYCLINNNYKSYPYTTAVSNNDTATLSYYNQNFIRYMVPTHSITYLGTSLALVSWRLVGATDGLTYISNVQSVGWQWVAPLENGYQPPENNNHPDRRYIQTSAEDSVYYLPKSQNYILYMTNTGASNLTMLVQILNPAEGADAITLKRKKLTVGMAEQSYTIVSSGIPNTAIPQIKINCNRTSTTDTDSDI